MLGGLAAAGAAASPLLAIMVFFGSGAADIPTALPACLSGLPAGDGARIPDDEPPCPEGTDSTSAQGCTVRPDPTTGRGCLTPRTAALAVELLARGWNLSCWDEHVWNPRSDHPQGRACDVYPGQARRPQPAEQARGDALAAALQASSSATGVDYLIWSGRIWSSRRPEDGWRPYTGGGVYDPTDIVGGHYDHLHISVRP